MRAKSRWQLGGRPKMIALAAAPDSARASLKGAIGDTRLLYVSPDSTLATKPLHGFRFEIRMRSWSDNDIPDGQWPRVGSYRHRDIWDQHRMPSTVSYSRGGCAMKAQDETPFAFLLESSMLHYRSHI
jgi:hypothetical protein